MSTSKEYLAFIISVIPTDLNIKCKKMMGEILLYLDDVLFGGLYDNRFLIKKTLSNEKYNLSLDIPYPSAKAMYVVDTLNYEEIKELILNCVHDLKNKK